MVPAHRRIIMVGRALSRREQGPLIYSGFDKKHEDAARAQETTRYLFAFWYWVPPQERAPWAGRSHVKDCTAHETLMLATGELEEARRNFEYPASMSPQDLGRELLRTVWEPECVRRLGEIPEVFRGTTALHQAPAARAMEQERNRIVVG